MMYSEFFERTRVEVSYDEYHFIEESYYEFDGNKDEFCKEWLKDKRSGKWALELRLRKALEEQKAEYEARLSEKEENLEFYRDYTAKLNDSLKEAEKKIERAQMWAKHLSFKAQTMMDELN